MAEWLLILRLSLALLLYGFLGLVLWSLWQEFSHKETQPQPQPTPAWLSVIVGPQAGTKIQVNAITAVGRADDNQLILSDSFASGHHFLILWREARWWVEDLNSHNGTYLNDERLTQPHALVSGDRLRVGETVLQFEG